MIGYINLNSRSTNASLKIPKKKFRSKLKNGFVLSDNKIKIFGKYKILINGYITEFFCDDIKIDKDKPEESIYHIYKRYNEDLYKYIDGQFLIFIYDEEKDILKIMNDQYQANNFYYYLDNKNFFFGNNLKSLLGMLPFKPEFDFNSIRSFLATGFSYTEKTQFKNIYRLLPAFVLIYEDNKIKFTNYWKKVFKFDRRPLKNVEKKLDLYELKFSKSLKNYIEATNTKKLGCLLSGGHDTTFTLIQASKIYKKPIHTFTVSFREWGFDEGPKASEITKKVGGIHHRIFIEPKHLDLMPEVIRSMEEPCSSTSFPLYVCVKEASKYVDTLLGGDSGDTLYHEYYPVGEVHKYIKKLPASIRRLLHKLVYYAAKKTDWERFWEMEHVLSLFAKKDMYTNFFSRLLTYRHFNDKFLSKILDNKIGAKSSTNKYMLEIPITKKDFDDALIKSKMYYGVYIYIIPHTKKPLDYFKMNYYTAYLNRELLNFINTLPYNWLNGGSTFKKLINDAVKRKFHKMALMRYLTKRYVYTLQQSFDVPYHVLLRKRPKVLENLLIRLKHRGWYNNAELGKLFGELKGQKLKPHELFELKNHSYRVYTLLTFEIWCMEFLDKKNYNKKIKKIPLEKYLEI